MVSVEIAADAALPRVDFAAPPSTSLPGTAGVLVVVEMVELPVAAFS